MALKDKLLAVGCAVAVYLGIVALYLPEPAPRPVPVKAAPMCAKPKTETDASTCNPPCTAPQACIGGTCCLPAQSTMVAWAPDSLW